MEITPKNQADAIEAYVNQVQVKPKTEDLNEKDPRQQAIKSDTVVISETAKRIQAAQSQLETIQTSDRRWLPISNAGSKTALMRSSPTR